MSKDLEIILLKKRLHNLEVAFQACLGLLIDLQPPNTADDLQRILHDNYQHSHELGSYNKPEMVGNLDDVP